jgi:hypothetical protein
MTLERAVEILNEREHNGCAEWWLDRIGGRGLAVGGHHDAEVFSEFEAIAIAEKYAREAKLAAADPGLEFQDWAGHRVGLAPWLDTPALGLGLLPQSAA